MTRGWCPDVHAPMPSGDGLLARVKPPGGRLPATSLRAIADGAARYGNGILELTSRGNIQIRGLTRQSSPRFAAAMVAAGLADPDPARESRRNVITIPPCDDGRVAAIEETLAGIPVLASKFCVAIGPAEADLIVLGNTLWAEGKPYAFSLGTLRTLAINANGQRLKSTPQPQPAPADLLLALPFGQTDAAAFARLAGLTDDARTTPWRALHIPTPRNASIYAAAGFITDPADPRRFIAACPGAPGCASGTVPARADALRLAERGITNIHVSGCAKGCAYPRPALTLAGRAGRYDLIRHGRAGDAPAFTGLTLEQAITHPDPSMTARDYIRDGAAIYDRSFATIRAEADLARLSPAESRIAVRLIHACGMVEIARDLRFTPGFAAAARAALHAGAPILCDSKMVASGITRARLPAHNAVICTLDDPATPALARAIGNTRSAAALQLWGGRLGGAVVAIGNAPTALFHLLELLDADAAPPAAIIGLPVGFVGAAESKDALMAEAHLQSLVLPGRRGGSAMAVAAINAIASDAE